MSWSEALYERAKKQKAELQSQLEAMEASSFQTWERRNGSFVDTTEASKDNLRRKLAELDRIIERVLPDAVLAAII
jgi:hypothetical protein